MADLPDFLEQPTGKRDWHSSIGEFWVFLSWPLLAVDPGGDYSYVVWTIPAGYIAFTTDVVVSGQFSGDYYLYAALGNNVYRGYQERYQAYHHTFSTPIPHIAKQELVVYTLNHDIVPGYFMLNWLLWHQPASSPKKPKNDDPEERYKLGDFNFANVIRLPNRESLIIFNKMKEDKMNYLRVRDLYRPAEKKIASFHLRFNEAEEILNIRKGKPEKVKKVLEKYERKYKLRTPKFRK